jgi:prepilin-type N-terminal cleavage/methylation domain-containing protein
MMVAAPRENCFGSSGRAFVLARHARRGFSLVELVVVVGIVSVLMAVLLPAVGNVRRQARALVSASNLRQITAAVNAFADDGDGRYPPSVATIGMDDNWNWQPPFVLTGYRKRTPTMHRSVAAYLRPYIEDADVAFCPSAPRKHEYLQAAWNAADAWDNPDTPDPDALFGIYCLYWNYTGYLGEKEGLFRGPSGPARARREGRIVVTDYFGVGHWRSPQSYGCCERFGEAQITEGTGYSYSSAYWSRPIKGRPNELEQLRVTLRAGYTDGHVESYRPASAVPMRVILRPDLGEPYPVDADPNPGIFYLPRVGLR